MLLEDKIYQAVNSKLKCDVVDVSGDGTHFDLYVLSQEFEGKSKLERHRMIYQALGNQLMNEIHALSMKLLTNCD